MRTSDSSSSPKGKQGAVDHNTDRYPTVNNALTRVLQEGEFPDGQVEWIEVHCLASGELTFRVREPRSEETEGGYLAAP